MKNVISIVMLVFFAGLGAKAQQSEIYTTNGRAIKGYDPVAFFKKSKAVMGSDSLTYTYKNAVWFFSDRANLEAFKASPQHFAPQYGGYCAYGTADGHKAPTQTETWTIVNDKLYFNYNLKVKKAWSKDQPALIEKADKQWPVIKNKK